MASTIQKRFPTFAAVMTTSASAEHATSALDALLSTTGQVIVRAPYEFRFRIPWRSRGTLLTPQMSARVVSSVAGSNVYVRCPDESVWRVLQTVLLLTALGAGAFSLISGEPLLASWITLGALCVGLSATWYLGSRTIRLLRTVLPE